MRMRVLFGLVAGALILALVGCGSTETKTVTETVTVDDSDPAPETTTEAASEPLVTTDEPTATTIPDGTWAKGEYTPGTYRAKGGPMCEWEQRQSLGKEAEGAGQWGIGDSNILAEIDSPYFVTEGCGTWQKVD